MKKQSNYTEKLDEPVQHVLSSCSGEHIAWRVRESGMFTLELSRPLADTADAVDVLDPWNSQNTDHLPICRETVNATRGD